MSATIQQLASYWKQGAASPRDVLESVIRRAGPFSISFKDLEASRISTWRHGGLARIRLTQIFPGIETVNVNQLNLYQRKTGLSMDAGEVMSLCAIVRFLGAPKVAEIGTCDGNTTLNLAANMPEGGCVNTIDLPPNWDRKFVYDAPNSLWNVTDRNRTGIQYRGTAYESRIRQMLGDSAMVDWNELNPPLDLIFINECHFRDYVKPDTANTLRNIWPGGVIVWHDYRDIKDVSEVVDETARQITVRVVRGTRLAVGWQGPCPVPATTE